MVELSRLMNQRKMTQAVSLPHVVNKTQSTTTTQYRENTKQGHRGSQRRTYTKGQSGHVIRHKGSLPSYSITCLQTADLSQIDVNAVSRIISGY